MFSSLYRLAYDQTREAGRPAADDPGVAIAHIRSRVKRGYGSTILGRLALLAICEGIADADEAREPRC